MNLQGYPRPARSPAASPDSVLATSVISSTGLMTSGTSTSLASRQPRPADLNKGLENRPVATATRCAADPGAGRPVHDLDRIAAARQRDQGADRDGEDVAGLRGDDVDGHRRLIEVAGRGQPGEADGHLRRWPGCPRRAAGAWLPPAEPADPPLPGRRRPASPGRAGDPPPPDATDETDGDDPRRGGHAVRQRHRHLVPGPHQVLLAHRELGDAPPAWATWRSAPLAPGCGGEPEHRGHAR